jgi:hypothetical protein
VSPSARERRIGERQLASVRIGVHIDEAIAHVRGAADAASVVGFARTKGELATVERALVAVHNRHDAGHHGPHWAAEPGA